MINLRKYGKSPYDVAVIHGGPGALDGIAPIAREIAFFTGVLEPLQTKDSVEGQVQELRNVLAGNAEYPMILIGFSWGAWLSFILAARYRWLVKKLILVGSGAFEQRYAENIVASRLSRLSEKDRIEALNLIDNFDSASNDNKRLMELFTKADAYAPLPQKGEAQGFSYEIYSNVWAQAEKMRISGELLEMGKEIRCPVVAIQGDYDPHLAEGVREPLSRILKDFRFILLEKCGHDPSIEKYAREKFYQILKGEIH